MARAASSHNRNFDRLLIRQVRAVGLGWRRDPHGAWPASLPLPRSRLGLSVLPPSSQAMTSGRWRRRA